jgi:hypothetical protein
VPGKILTFEGLVRACSFLVVYVTKKLQTGAENGSSVRNGIKAM